MKTMIETRGCTTILVLALLTGLGAENAIAARVLYVATNGSDSNNGLSVSTPLATLEGAEAKVNFANGDHTIYLRGELTTAKKSGGRNIPISTT